MTAARRAAGNATSRIVAHALATSAGSQSRIAAALEVKRQAVEKWCDADDERAITLRDVLAAARAGEREFARGVLLTLLGVIDSEAPRPPREGLDAHFRRLAAKTGDVAKLATELLREGKPDGKARARIHRELGALRAEVYAMACDIEAGA